MGHYSLPHLVETAYDIKDVAMWLTTSALKEPERSFDEGERLGKRWEILIVVVQVKLGREVQDKSVQQFFVPLCEGIGVLGHRCSF